jgi:hypothetical protein
MFAVRYTKCRPRPLIGAMFMQIQLPAVFQKVREEYIGFVKELPGANMQGATLEKATALQEAITMEVSS